MSDIEMLQRKIREDKAHIQALTEAVRKANNDNIRRAAQIKTITESAAARLTECCTLIDSLHDRIEFMVDTWQAEIRNDWKDNEEEKKKRLEAVEPFRPKRIGDVKVT